MKNYCTYFDKNFIPQGLALYNSLIETCGDTFVLYILSLDSITASILESMRLKNVVLLKEEDLHKFDNRLIKAKNNRSKIEYYYCFTANLLRYIIHNYKNINSLAYIDADMFFFKNYDNLLLKYKECDILLVPHNIPDLSNGRFNVCYNHFKINENGIAAINWWAEKTLESTELGNGIWGDQKYLDEFPILFKNVGIIKEKEFASAPWNIMQCKLSKKNGIILIDEEPLICYHFARLLVVNKHFFLPIKRTYISKDVLNFIYLPYLFSLKKTFTSIKDIVENYNVNYTKKNFIALIGSIPLGRLFYVSNKKMYRVGFNLPIAYK